VIGLAKDGRLIYGPYKTGGLLWDTCDVDICNGRWMGNFYSYVSTNFFPYTVGCWGPGNSPIDSNMHASCSKYPRQCPFIGNYVSNAVRFSSYLGITIIMALIVNLFA
jgi:hypothetical protein